MQAYKIMARDTRTGLRIQQQDLSGQAITDLELAHVLAQELAQKQSARSRASWVAEVSEYTVGANSNPKI
jgi:hypothetical protein